DPPQQKRSLIIEIEEELKNITKGKGVEGGRETSGFIAKTKTPLIKYYTHQANVANRKGSAMRKQNIHRDEFPRCKRCGKERRFHLKSTPDIKNYHDALNNKCRTCSLWPYQKITCDDDEEGSSLKASRGCSRSSTCQDCSTCYCEGCIKCRFEDCNCQECRVVNLNINHGCLTSQDNINHP
ncbi:Protein ULTRAPETALA 1, partial [Glycine soja]